MKNCSSCWRLRCRERSCGFHDCHESRGDASALLAGLVASCDAGEKQRRTDLGFDRYPRLGSWEASRPYGCVSDRERTGVFAWACDRLWKPWPARWLWAHWLRGRRAGVLLGVRRSRRRAVRRAWTRCALVRRRLGRVRDLALGALFSLPSLPLVELLDVLAWSFEQTMHGTWGKVESCIWEK